MAICKRLRSARERLGLGQAEVARQLGITRERLLIYEYCRAPLRADLALGFCRQFVISEEWLATGEYLALRDAALPRGLAETDSLEEMPEFFFRQCVDLRSEALNAGVPVGALFSEAFAKYLAPVYRKLVAEFFYIPRVCMLDSDNPEIVQNFLATCVARWLRLLENEAVACRVDAGRVRREFLRVLYEAGLLYFIRFMGQPTPEVQTPQYRTLQVLVMNPEMPIGSLHSGSAENAEPTAESHSSGLDESKLTVDKSRASTIVGAVKQIPKTWFDLRQSIVKATGKRGAKSQLAAKMKVSRQAVDKWLNQDGEPSADITLRLLEWVTTHEAKQ